MIPSLYAFHMDKNIWGDPENFRPQRFLDSEGNFSLKKDITLPFGAGKYTYNEEMFHFFRKKNFKSFILL